MVSARVPSHFNWPLPRLPTEEGFINICPAVLQSKDSSKSYFGYQY
jgi:hypothetical protein